MEESDRAQKTTICGQGKSRESRMAPIELHHRFRSYGKGLIEVALGVVRLVAKRQTI